MRFIYSIAGPPLNELVNIQKITLDSRNDILISSRHLFSFDHQKQISASEILPIFADNKKHFPYNLTIKFRQ